MKAEREARLVPTPAAARLLILAACTAACAGARPASPLPSASQPASAVQDATNRTNVRAIYAGLGPLAQEATEESTGRATRSDEETALPPPEGIDRVIGVARRHLGKRVVRVNGRTFRWDCSGFVRGMFSVLGVDLMWSPSRRSDNGVRLIHRWVAQHGQNHFRKVPRRGDVVYFDNSYDMNRDGKLNDRLTHVGLVESVLDDGTALVLHLSRHGIVREPMNLSRPRDAFDESGRLINAQLRAKGRRDTAGTPRLMGELFAGFGTVAVPRDRASADAPAAARLACACKWRSASLF